MPDLEQLELDGVVYDVRDPTKATAGYGYGGTVPVIQTAATDGVTFENLVDEFAATMTDNSVKQVIMYDQSLATQQFVATVWKNNQDRIVIDAVTYGNNMTTAVKKLKMYGEWQPWEWVNPPMALGVEYRTTERWNGKAVYTKVISFGYMPNASQKSVAHGLTTTAIVGLHATTSSGKYFFPCSSASTDVGSVDLYIQSSSIFITTTTDWSAYVAYVTIKYTKD